MELFAEADLTAYARTPFAPSYMPFAATRQRIRETKSARYPKRKIAKAAISCNAKLNITIKAIGDPSGPCFVKSQ